MENQNNVIEGTLVYTGYPNTMPTDWYSRPYSPIFVAETKSLGTIFLAAPRMVLDDAAKMIELSKAFRLIFDEGIDFSSLPVYALAEFEAVEKTAVGIKGKLKILK